MIHSRIMVPKILGVREFVNRDGNSRTPSIKYNHRSKAPPGGSEAPFKVYVM